MSRRPGQRERLGHALRQSPPSIYRAMSAARPNPGHWRYKHRDDDGLFFKRAWDLSAPVSISTNHVECQRGDEKHIQARQAGEWRRDAEMLQQNEGVLASPHGRVSAPCVDKRTLRKEEHATRRLHCNGDEALKWPNCYGQVVKTHHHQGIRSPVAPPVPGILEAGWPSKLMPQYSVG
jgi:hypothetical protein